MIGTFRAATVASGAIFALLNATLAFAQKHGGILRLSHFDSPASMSILEESTRAAVQLRSSRLPATAAGCAPTLAVRAPPDSRLGETPQRHEPLMSLE